MRINGLWEHVPNNATPGGGRILFHGPRLPSALRQKRLELPPCSLCQNWRVEVGGVWGDAEEVQERQALSLTLFSSTYLSVLASGTPTSARLVSLQGFLPLLTAPLSSMACGAVRDIRGC